MLVDQPHVHVGVDAHLLARHAVQRETRGHFGHTLRTGGDDYVLHHHQNQEDHNTDHVIAADYERTDRADDASCIGAIQDQACCRHVQCQPEHRRDQQQGRKGRKIQWRFGKERHQQYQQCQADIDDQQQVQQRRRHRYEQHHQDTDHQPYQGQVSLVLQEGGQDALHAAALLRRLAYRVR
ncbi:hypothetical protein FHY22_003095 [Xanthomonas arboricola]|nr:hypothetical protein [Xanthomonas arboricola]